MTDAAAPAAGWYADPRAAELWRWWDGARWTAHTLPRDPAPSPEPSPSPSPEPDPAPVPLREPVAVAQAAGASDWTPPRFDWGALDEPVPSVESPVAADPALPIGHYIENGVQYNAAGFPVKTEAPTATPAAPASASFGASAPAWAPSAPTRTEDSATPAGWALHLTPLWAAMLGTVIPFGVALAAPGSSLLVQGICSLACLVLAWVLAAVDRAQLGRRGLPTASIAWMLLLPPLLYLVVRGRALRAAGHRIRPGGWVYLVSIVGAVALAFGAVSLANGALLGRVPPATAPSDDAHAGLTVGATTPDGEYLGELAGGRALLEQQTADLIAAYLGLEPGFSRLECTTPLRVGATTPGCHFEAAVPEGDAVRTTTVDATVTIDLDLGVFALATP